MEEICVFTNNFTDFIKNTSDFSLVIIKETELKGNE